MLPEITHGMVWLDYAVIVLYLLLTLGIGLYHRKSASTNLDSFFLGGRRVPGWANGFSYAATCLNSDVAPAYVAWTVGAGLFVAWFYFTRFGLALMIGGILFAFFWRRLQLFTSPEFYELRFPGVAGTIIRPWIAFRSAFIAIVAWSGTGLIGLSKVTEPVFGWSKITTISVIVPLVLFYVFVSGYLGVVTTDIFQSLIILIGSVALCVFVLMEHGGPAGLAESIERGLGSATALQSFPPLDHAELGLVAIVALVVGTSIGYGGDVAPMGGAMEGQRILSSKNGREAIKMYIWTEVLLFLLLLVICLPGLGALAKWPELYNAPREVRELAFGRLLSHYMPPGFLGLAIAALLASLMSTLSANFNFGAQIFTNDIYRRFIKPGASERHLLWVGRGTLFVICALAIGVALGLNSIIDIAVFMIGLSSAELAANWAQWWWWRFNTPGRLAASFGGPVIFYLVRFPLTRFLEEHKDIQLSEWSAILISMGVTTVFWLAATLLTPPQDERVLMEFYRRAKPLGFWGPIRKKLGQPPGSRSIVMILLGFGIAALGTAWIACMILAFSNLFIGFYGKAGILGALALGGGWLFKRMFTKYVMRISQWSIEEPLS